MRLLQTEAFVNTKGKIYASAMNKNALYVYDEESEKVEWMLPFEGVDQYEWRLHSTAVIKDEMIYFLPFRLGGFHVVNIETHENHFVPFETYEDSKFRPGFFIGHKLYCIRYSPKPAILVYDINTAEQQEISFPGLHKKSVIQRDYHIEDGVLYLVDNSQPVLIEIDCEKMTARTESILSDNEYSYGFGTVSKMGEKLFFSTDKGILIWNCVSKQSHWITDFPESFGMKYRDSDGAIKKISGFVDVFGSHEQPFAQSICGDNEVVFLPNRTNMCIQLDFTTEKLSEIYMQDEEETELTLNTMDRITHMHYLCGNTVQNPLFFSTCSRRIYSSKSFKQGDWGCIQDNEILWRNMYGESFFSESDECGLALFIDAIE